MPQAILGVVAILGFIFAYLMQANSLLCQTELCKEAERQRQYAEKVDHTFKMKRAEAEADDRFTLEKTERQAAAEVRVNDSKVRVVKAQAEADLQREIEMVKIQAAERSEARKDGLAMARATVEIERAKAYRRPPPMHVTNFMVARGMGQPRRVHPCCGPRQPRVETVLRTGYPGLYRQPRW